ncbi:hypothetical protein [Methylotuvimicrobium sp. KM1]|uniref:hypothetical protein n=1 Tax=Methylotuvimicrobium sp. KM1 TaxID=3377707 RepID=UPI00384D46A7
MAHYLALLQFDLRHLQQRLAQAGLSSLGRAESSIMSTLDTAKFLKLGVAGMINTAS